MKWLSSFTLGMLRLLTLFCVALAAAWPRDAAAHPSGHPSRRALLQTSEVTLNIANFTYMKDVTLSGNHDFNESVLGTGGLPVIPGVQPLGPQEIQYGAYDLSPQMVGEFLTKLSEETVRLPTLILGLYVTHSCFDATVPFVGCPQGPRP